MELGKQYSKSRVKRIIKSLNYNPQWCHILVAKYLYPIKTQPIILCLSAFQFLNIRKALLQAEVSYLGQCVRLFVIFFKIFDFFMKSHEAGQKKIYENIIFVKRLNLLALFKGIHFLASVFVKISSIRVELKVTWVFDQRHRVKPFIAISQ